MCENMMKARYILEIGVVCLMTFFGCCHKEIEKTIGQGYDSFWLF